MRTEKEEKTIYKIQRLRGAFFTILCCLLIMSHLDGASQVGGEKFIVESARGFTLPSLTRAEDFNLYEVKLEGRTVARLYEGDNPDFPYSKAIGSPRAISSQTTLLSTDRIKKGNQFKRDHLIQFSECDGFCTIHVWYDGVTKSDADRIDAFVCGIRRKK